ncbi:MAG: hypothetical protein WBM44_20200 [Waterburya sp.]
MSDSSSWHQYSVKKFFSQSNWEGNHQKKELDEMYQEISWLCLKIEEFFSRSNWQGELLGKISHPSFSLTLTVNEFFQCFAWDVDLEIAALTEFKSTPKPKSLPNDHLKLNEFTDLF